MVSCRFVFKLTHTVDFFSVVNLQQLFYITVTCLETQDVEVGEEVLAIASTELPLDSVELATLATQATRLLEEHDFNNVLGTITADAFNDLFTGTWEKHPIYV